MADKPCVVCGKDVPRGTRYIGPSYKTEKFCSEECYNRYIELRAMAQPNEKYPGWVKLLDYINELYPPDSVNWPVVTKQIVQTIEKYDLTCDNIRNIIKYAIVYEHYTVNNDYYLGQFIPKYIEPYKSFIQAIKQNRTESESMGDDEVYYIKPIKQIGNINSRGRDEFDTLSI